MKNSFHKYILAISLSIATLFLYLKLIYEIYENELMGFDLRIIQYVYTLRTPALTKIMLFVSSLGANFMVFLTLAVAVVLVIKKYYHEAFLFLFLAAGGEALNVVLKQLVARPRPTISPLISETSYSFPSGHSMGSLIVYLLLAYGVFYFTRSNRKAAFAFLFAFLLIGLIGVSRIYLGVHYPTDVLGGYIAGIWWVVTLLLLDKIGFRRFSANRK